MEMKLNEFWKSWKDKTPLELKAIKSIKAAEKILTENIPKDQLLSIYVMGSFVRREMNKKSDVDFLVVIKDNKYLPKIQSITYKFGHTYDPRLSIAGYSLWELKTGKKYKFKSARKLDKPFPIKVAPMLPGCMLIYGKPINAKMLIQRTPQGDVEGMISSFRETLFPAYERGVIGFDFLVKQVFWIAYDEQRALGKKPPFEWRKLNSFVKDKNHIVHEAMNLRLNPPKSNKTKEEFLVRLKKYLKNMEKLK